MLLQRRPAAAPAGKPVNEPAPLCEGAEATAA
jgi:hypothetical protein